jgi:hypothetical protein
MVDNVKCLGFLMDEVPLVLRLPLLLTGLSQLNNTFPKNFAKSEEVTI